MDFGLHGHGKKTAFHEAREWNCGPNRIRGAQDVGAVAFITGGTTTSLKNIYLCNNFKMVTTLPMTSS